MRRNGLLIFTLLVTVTSGKHIQEKEIDKLNKVFADKGLYFEGKEDRQTDITEKDLPKNGERFEGDMIMDDDIRQAVLGANSKRSAVALAGTGNRKHWPGGIVPYVIGHKTLAIIRRRIYTAIEEFNYYTCVRFIPKRENDEDYVYFTSEGKGGCSSSVGRIGGRQRIHLSGGCKRIGTVMHEMMHALGIVHEQSRPDRDGYLLVKYDNIRSDLAHNFRKYQWNDMTKLDIPYNYNSVMEYSNYAFSKNGKRTLISKYDKNLKFGQRVQLSHLDVVQINKLYNCHKHYDDEDLMEDWTADFVMRKKRDSENHEEELIRSIFDY